MKRTRLLFALPVMLLAACAAREPIDENYPEFPEVVVPEAQNGAIYQAGYDVALFENATARRVGDIVTIRLIEATNASKSSSTTTKKATKLDLPGPILFGRPVTANGVPILETQLDHTSDFGGQGDSKQSNQLTGDITVAVIRRLPNGNLLVRGEKRITINQGQEFIRLQGIVRPVDIGPANTVPSTKIADATITYTGKGTLADSNRQGWLSRFFNSPWFPF